MWSQSSRNCLTTYWWRSLSSRRNFPIKFARSAKNMHQLGNGKLTPSSKCWHWVSTTCERSTSPNWSQWLQPHPNYTQLSCPKCSTRCATTSTRSEWPSSAAGSSVSMARCLLMGNPLMRLDKSSRWRPMRLLTLLLMCWMRMIAKENALTLWSAGLWLRCLNCRSDCQGSTKKSKNWWKDISIMQTSKSSREHLSMVKFWNRIGSKNAASSLKLYLSRVTRGFLSAKVTELPQMQKINPQLRYSHHHRMRVKLRHQPLPYSI